MRALLLILVSTVAAVPVAAEDWPGWRGKDRRGVWKEDGILERFPEKGLTYTWRVPIGEGYSGPAVAGGRVFVTDFVRDGESIRGKERGICLDEETGRELWKHEWPVNYEGTQPKWATGPRATPTVDGDRVYFVGGMGRMWCLYVKTGRPAWQRDLVRHYGAEVPNWGVASSPLIKDDKLYMLVGGKNGTTVVAFDKFSGTEKWRALELEGDPGYAPPIIVRSGGEQQLIIWHPTGIHSLDPETGEPFWEHPYEVKMALTVATPVVSSDRLLFSSFMEGALLLQLDAERPGAAVLWHRKGASEMPEDTEGLHALISTPVMRGSFIYGVDSYGELRGLSAKSGDRLWESLDLIEGKPTRWAAAMIVHHEDRYVVNNDRGELIFADFDSKGYREIDRTPLIEPTTAGGGRREMGAVNWSHPAYANRHVVARNDKEIVRASLAIPPPPAEPEH